MINSKTNNLLLSLMLASGLAVSAVGCGKAQPLGNDVLTTGASIEETPEMGEINAKLQEMDTQIYSVDQELQSLQLQNPLSLLGDNLKNAVGNFSGFLGKFKEKIEELKFKINTQIAKLDPNDPQQQRMIAELQKGLTYLDQVSSKLDSVVAKIQSKIDEVFAKIEQKIASHLSGIPGILAQLVLGKLKDSVLGRLLGGI